MIPATHQDAIASRDDPSRGDGCQRFERAKD
jgi:hypothetical protein